MAEKKDKRKRRRRIILIILAAGAAILLINIFAAGEEKPRVTVETVQPRKLSSVVSGPGHVRPSIEVELTALTTGQITRIPVKEGQRVSKGDLIVEIDPDQSESLLSQARAAYSGAVASKEQAAAALEQAEEEYERQRQLYEDGLISAQEWTLTQTQLRTQRAALDAANSQIYSASAQVRAARDGVEKTRYISSIDGVVVALNVEEGEMAVPGTTSIGGTPLATVASLEGMLVEADIDETDVVDLEVGQPAEIYVDAFNDRVFTGVVTEIANSASTTLAGTSEEVVNFEIKVVIEDEVPPNLYPGMSATVEITTATVEDALTIPISAVVIRDAETVADWLGEGFDPAGQDEIEGVFVNDNDSAAFRPIETGISDQTHIEVLAGLEENESIISGPYKELRTLAHGDEIERQQADDAGGED